MTKNNTTWKFPDEDRKVIGYIEDQCHAIGLSIDGVEVETAVCGNRMFRVRCTPNAIVVHTNGTVELVHLDYTHPDDPGSKLTLADDGSIDGWIDNIFTGIRLLVLDVVNTRMDNYADYREDMQNDDA